jgi:2',3'-cyclic-nucleotide 2'-phosphodiesterase (5'-nucleotidase family)
MKRIFLYLSLVFILGGCSQHYRPNKVTYYDYRINNKVKGDTSLLSFLSPYRDSLDKTMNDIINTIEAPLEKKQPNGSLGLVFVDAMRIMAEQKFGGTVDAAFVNNGGLRVNGLPAGNLTVGKVYEVMPFDNLLVVQKIRGSTLNMFLDTIAKKGGWPVSGITFDIVNGKAKNVKINGVELDWNNYYRIANSDYIANGGDDCDVLKKIPAESKNILLRDAFLEYFKQEQAKGRKVNALNEERVKKINN